MPPLSFMKPKYALMPSLSSASCPPSGLVFDVIEPTLISVLVTPFACTGTFLVKSVPLKVVAVLPPVVGFEPESLLEPALLHAPANTTSASAPAHAAFFVFHVILESPQSRCA